MNENEIMKAAIDRFVANGLDRDDVERRFAMFKAYFDETFNAGEKRDRFWRAIHAERYFEACGYMLAIHAMWLFEMRASVEGRRD